MGSVPSNYYPLIGAAIFVVLLYLAKKRGGVKMANPLKSFTAPKKASLVQAFEEIDAKADEIMAEMLTNDIAASKAAEKRAAFVAALAPKPVPNGPTGPASS